MGEPISLYHLRADIEARVDRQTLYDNDNPYIDLPVSEVLALIDVAEAAHNLRELFQRTHTRDQVETVDASLDAALARFDFRKVA